MKRTAALVGAQMLVRNGGLYNRTVLFDLEPLRGCLVGAELHNGMDEGNLGF